MTPVDAQSTAITLTKSFLEGLTVIPLTLFFLLGGPPLLARMGASLSGNEASVRTLRLTEAIRFEVGRLYEIRLLVDHDPAQLADARREARSGQHPNVVTVAHDVGFDTFASADEQHDRGSDLRRFEVRDQLRERSFGAARSQPVDDVEKPHLSLSFAATGQAAAYPSARATVQ